MTDQYVQLADVSSIVSAVVEPLEHNGSRGYIMRLGTVDGEVHNYLIDQVGMEHLTQMMDKAKLAAMFAA